MHTALRLLALNHSVVVLDSVSPYYSPALKRLRLRQLGAAGAVLVEGDVCNATLVHAVLADYAIRRVVHMAAQPGVRHSLEHPLEAVDANVRCFVVLLQALVRANLTGTPLIYASSSSVYGLTTAAPFSETHPVNTPASVYAATKRADELLAAAFFNLHRLASVGLRFFTVYGPLGRPDMAYYRFVDDIVHGRPITVYGRGGAIRDFTYIADVVDGVVAALSMNATGAEVVVCVCVYVYAYVGGQSRQRQARAADAYIPILEHIRAIRICHMSICVCEYMNRWSISATTGLCG